RLFSILDEKPEPGYLSRSPAHFKALKGAVTFRNVSFSYGANTPILHHLSFEAKPGEMIALVGPTGSGKSTLVNLLSRFYEINEGEILLDGHPINKLPLDFLRRSIGMVTQESFLFNGTTADNLRIGRADISEEEMWEALKAANAAAFVSRLPEGLHTPLGERGIKLSVGEKQRISIARALLKNPPILILDEATASLDNTTERLIQEALQRLLAGRTSFVIAHRLSTIRNATEILVLDRGQIVERGTHETLLEKNGLYAQLDREAARKE
ncbi:MAG: ATP-binding cassette domain-containing protein, partial [Verrucomicrobiota bacterium]